jgi:hypothetical protein
MNKGFVKLKPKSSIGLQTLDIVSSLCQLINFFENTMGFTLWPGTIFLGNKWKFSNKSDQTINSIIKPRIKQQGSFHVSLYYSSKPSQYSNSWKCPAWHTR